MGEHSAPISRRGYLRTTGRMIWLLGLVAVSGTLCRRSLFSERTPCTDPGPCSQCPRRRHCGSATSHPKSLPETQCRSESGKSNSE